MHAGKPVHSPPHPHPAAGGLRSKLPLQKCNCYLQCPWKSLLVEVTVDVVSITIWQVLNDIQNDAFKHIPRRAFPFRIAEMRKVPHGRVAYACTCVCHDTHMSCLVHLVATDEYLCWGIFSAIPRLGTWLSGSKLMLLFQRTRVQLPGPRSDTSQLLVTNSTSRRHQGTPHLGATPSTQSPRKECIHK